MSTLCLDCGKLHEGRHQCSKTVLSKYCPNCKKDIPSFNNVCSECKETLLESTVNNEKNN